IKKFIDQIDECIDNSKITPKVNRELAITQAALESQYGLSRFARHANNLYGIKIFENLHEGVLPLGRPPSIKWRMARFDTKCESVDAYMNLLNTGSNFEEYRQERDYQNHFDIDEPEEFFKTMKLYATNVHYEKLLLNTYNSIKDLLK
ncbi:MAG: glucosaminidase domain-containing protein, partial [Pelagibacteraceae bacterium]